MAQGKKAAVRTRFKLSGKAQAKLNKYLAEIRRGIYLVCEMHTHDSNPSLEKEDFEEIYIDKLLGMTVGAVRLSIKGMTEGLAAQKEKELQGISQGEAPAEKKEDKQ